MFRRFPLALLLVLCMGFEWPGRLPRLQYELGHADPVRRREAARMLAQYAADDVREPLLQALEDDDVNVRLDAAQTLAALGVVDAVPTLLPWLGDKSPEVRATAARALGVLADPRAREPLTRLLGDSVASVRVAAVSSLGVFADTESVTAVLSALDDTDASVRRAGVLALAGKSDPRMLAPLAKRIHDDDALVRAAALQVLGGTRAPQTLALLLQGLSDATAEVRLAASQALGALGDPGAITALGNQLAREPSEAQAAAAALGHIDDPRAQSVLVQQLGHAELCVASQAALVERVRRVGDAESNDAARPSVLQSLALVVSHPQTELQLRCAAQTLVELAPMIPLAPVSSTLIRALHEGDHPPAELLQAVALTHDEQARVPLLERLEQADQQTLEPTLDALSTYFAASPVDGTVADPLLARLPGSSGQSRIVLLRLLGETGAARAVPAITPLLASTLRREQHAAALALAAIAAAPSKPTLLQLMASPDPALRSAAAHGLRELVDVTDLAGLLDTASGTAPGDAQTALIVLGPALARLQTAGQLPAALRQRALELLTALTHSPDAVLAAHALSALRRFAPKEGATIAAQLLKAPALRQRAAAATALGAFDGEDSRKLLRYLLQRQNVRVLTAALGSLAELGDQRDVAAILRATQHGHWPVQGAAAYALARMTLRGAVKQRSMQRVLCELGASRDPYVRANVAAAMAALGAPACDDKVSPLAWLDARHAAAVRAAAAGWARAAAAAGSLPASEAAAALRACTADADPSVATACALPEGHSPVGPVEVLVHDDDHSALLRNRLVALRLHDGTVFLGYSDDAGEVLLRSAPEAPVVEEDPTATPREPR